MSLSKDNRQKKPTGQSRTQKIIMWSVFGVAAAMLLVALFLFVSSGAPLF